MNAALPRHATVSSWMPRSSPASIHRPRSNRRWRLSTRLTIRCLPTSAWPKLLQIRRSCNPNGRWKSKLSKRRRKWNRSTAWQVVLAAFIDDANVTILGGVRIRNDRIDLVQLQGSQIARVVHARYKTRMCPLWPPILHQSKYRFLLISLLPRLIRPDARFYCPHFSAVSLLRHVLGSAARRRERY